MNDDQPTRCVEVPYTTSEDSTALPPGEESPDSGYTGVQKFCIDVEWPGASTWNSRQRRGVDKLGPASWMGSLITDQRDASGQIYRRNRYYDQQSGRFTQEAPLGLAGGLNLYGFANGDPAAQIWDYGYEYGCRTRSDIRRAFRTASVVRERLALFQAVPDIHAGSESPHLAYLGRTNR